MTGKRKADSKARILSNGLALLEDRRPQDPLWLRVTGNNADEVCRMKKILWVKFGWSEYYRGGPVDGNFGWLNDHRGKKDEGRGHEAFNFMRVSDGTYYGYVPPQIGDYAPWNEAKTGWTVVCLAKNPKHKGIYVVGWYENATLIGGWKKSPLNHLDDGAGELSSPYDSSYCITSKSAFFIPPELRSDPFSDPSVGQGKYSFLSGPNVEVGPNKRRVLKLLEEKLAALRDIAVHNPDDTKAPDPEINLSDPLIVFGTPEHRKRVELAAERAVVSYYKMKGFTKRKRVAKLNLGYDYIFAKAKGRTVLLVEVKGTAAAKEWFFLTRNENRSRIDPKWRLAMVTDALKKKPNVKIYNNEEFNAAFDLEPYIFIGKRVEV